LSKKKANNKNGGGGAAKSTGPASPMNVGLLEQIVKLMAANDLNTVDLRDGEQRVVLKRGAAAAAYVAAPPVSYAAPAPQSSGGAASAAQSPGSGPAPAPDEAHLVPITSPMVGTFYSAASPDAKPFVQVGSSVVADETDVCIIEAMKVFNNIKSEVNGTIAKILVSNGETVEFGQTLFLVKP
jgi:acetyl-CoA carboxylase biotin carboxyl carrier protein